MRASARRTIFCAPFRRFCAHHPKNPYFDKSLLIIFFINDNIKEPYYNLSYLDFGWVRTLYMLIIYQRSKGNEILPKTQNL